MARLAAYVILELMEESIVNTHCFSKTKTGRIESEVQFIKSVVAVGGTAELARTCLANNEDYREEDNGSTFEVRRLTSN